MIDKFDQEAQKIIVMAESLAFDLGHDKVATYHLLLAILNNPKMELTKQLQLYNVNKKIVNRDIVKLVGKKDNQPFYLEYSDGFKDILDKSIETSENKNKKLVSLNILCIELLSAKNCVVNTILNSHISQKNISKIIDNLKENIELIEIEGCENFTSVLQPKKEKIILGRDKEVQNIVVRLCCNEKSNIALLGKAGVGKTAIVEELARVLKYECPKQLDGYQIVCFDSTSAISGTKYRGEFEEKVNKLIKGIKDKKVIIFIDEGHVLNDLGKAEGSPSISELLKPILARHGTKFIIATTEEEYQKFISQNKAFSRRFRNIIIQEPHINDIPYMIKNKIKKYSLYHDVNITNDNINDVIKLSKSVPNRYFPDKVLDVIDYTMAYCKLNGKKNFDIDIALEYINSMLESGKLSKYSLLN